MNNDPVFPPNLPLTPVPEQAIPSVKTQEDPAERFAADYRPMDGRVTPALVTELLLKRPAELVHEICEGQAVYSAIKMPALFFAVVLASGILNTMLAQVLGAHMPLRRGCLLILLGMAVAALVMGALSPVVAFFVLQAPPPDPTAIGLPSDHPAVVRSMRVFRQLLLVHVAVIGFAGTIGNIRLLRLLRQVLPTRALANRILLVWLAVTGFVGCELAWLLSPFLCKPNFPAHFVARMYHQGNFYEQVYHALRDAL